MYVQPIFAEDDPQALHALIGEHPLGSLVALTAEGLEANHIPFELQAGDGGADILRGHVSRSNPLWSAVTSGQEVMVLFHGPNHYISPSWQPASQTHGRVAPSWNYAVVHAYGRLSIVEDEGWLLAHLDRLIAAQEAGRAAPWDMTRAPAEFIGALARNIVGLEIEVTRLVGKWQACQQYNAAARDGIVAGLMAEPDPAGPAVGAFVRARAPV